MVDVALVASVRLALGVVLLRGIILTAADVVGSGQDIVVQVFAALVIVFLK